MKAELKKNSLNQVMKGTEIFCEGEPVTDIGLVIKGRVRVQAEGINIVVGSGNFLGICDLKEKLHNVTYVAETDLAIYIFSASDLKATVAALIKINKDYGPLLVSTLSKYIREIHKTYAAIKQCEEETHDFMQETYQSYISMGNDFGVKVNKISAIEDLGDVPEDGILDGSLIDYYKVCTTVPNEVQKAFYGANPLITLHHVTEQTALVRDLLFCCKEKAEYLKGLAGPLILNDRSLYLNILQQATMLQKAGENTGEVTSIFDDVIDKINALENVMLDHAGVNLEIDHDFMEEAYFELMNGGKASSASSDGATEAGDESAIDLSVLDGALDTILEYGDVEDEDGFKDLIAQFIDLKDKFSTEDEARTLRRGIIKVYYNLYRNVFLKDYRSSEETPVVIDLFLRYGFLSEKLVTKEIMKDLLSIDRSTTGMGECDVYDMKEWLTMIISGQKEPSKSEFDLDFDENLREMRKTGQITVEQQEQLSRDTKAKFDYELDNMFKPNHRLVFSQVTAFVPFLFTEACANSIERSYLSKDKINITIQKLRRIDFSVFYREGLYGKEGPFIKEYVQEEVYPDVIMMPGYGNKGVMWQEISGRRRNSKGRFLLPIFMESDLESVMIKLLGRFRWELCRTIQGSAWNNIQIKSLTSEYSDFIQFYKKNRDLSEEKKEKLKMQIQKNRNNTREVFVVDYENWMKHESKGGLLLSKPVREILATYCPFAKDIREKLGEQPMYRDAMAKYYRERGKKAKEYDLKFKVWNKDGIDVPPEIVETKDYYTAY